MQESQESFVLEHIRSNSLSLVEKIELAKNFDRNKSGRDSDAVKKALEAEVKKVLDPMDARTALKFWEESGYVMDIEFEIIPKITPGCLTEKEVVACLTNMYYSYYPLINALMAVVDWKSVPKDKLMRTLGRSTKERVWEILILQLEVFTEAELLELNTGSWKGKWLQNNFLGTYTKFRNLMMASSLVSKTEKVKLAIGIGPENAKETFKILLEHTEFSDEELLSIAEARTVSNGWKIIQPYLKKYRNLLKVARLLKSDEAWDVFIEKAGLEGKKPSQILRVARVSGYPKIWSLYFKKATEPAVAHEELMRRGTKSKRYELWTVLLDHVDPSKLTLDWIVSFIQGCAYAAEEVRSCGGFGFGGGGRFSERKAQLYKSFESATVLANKIQWKSVPYEKRVELLRMYRYDPWQEAIANSLESVSMKDFVVLGRNCQGKVVDILRAKVVQA